MSTTPVSPRTEQSPSQGLHRTVGAQHRVSELEQRVAPSAQAVVEDPSEAAAQARTAGGFLRPVQSDHPWAGRSFSAGWGLPEKLKVLLVVAETVVEVSADISRDTRGRLRHPVRFVRVRADMAVEDVPPFEVRRPEGRGR
ncbi:hypothetical protein [Streptomyces sp. NPDC003032]